MEESLWEFTEMIIAVSGGFDPLHVGHVRYILGAAEYGDVHVFLNSDKWLLAKKGFVFMNFTDRKEIILALRGVITVSEAGDDDGTVCLSLVKHKPKFFAKGGDRTLDNTPERKICEELGIRVIYGVGGGKIESSSDLVARAELNRRVK